ncbi:hypothetical protein BDV25DRAFT_14660 [Aspergillus avenaceus]|uniref:Uncharacterized protein n=1 Tax=Aspergillus avenaceus TaxID=36643 RepID=A0A5N6U566_ASPAV|nr:hypothetical protein BDV25DRAFT_14660 [Aspergillus avenaceus]
MKPTILFVAGAWIVPGFYFLNTIQAAGYLTVSAELASLNPADPATSDCAANAERIEHQFSTPIEEE